MQVSDTLLWDFCWLDFTFTIHLFCNIVPAEGMSLLGFCFCHSSHLPAMWTMPPISFKFRPSDPIHNAPAFCHCVVLSLCPSIPLKCRGHDLLAKTAKAEGPNPDRFGLLLVGCSIFSWAILSFSMWVEAVARKFFKPNLEAVGAVETTGTFLRSTWNCSYGYSGLNELGRFFPFW